MGFASGLKEPEPDVQMKTEPLWLKYAMGGYTGAKGAKTQSMLFDENRSIKKKFRENPSTQAETRDCAMTLNRKEMHGIITHPEIMNFGAVCIHGKVQKNFSVYNSLDKNIIISLAIDECKNLSQSSPTQQLVPAGKVAGFDLIFQSSAIGNFDASIFYKINDTHTKELRCAAEVIPTNLELST
eukprot:UN32819